MQSATATVSAYQGHHEREEKLKGSVHPNNKDKKKTYFSSQP